MVLSLSRRLWIDFNPSRILRSYSSTSVPIPCLLESVCWWLGTLSCPTARIEISMPINTSLKFSVQDQKQWGTGRVALPCKSLQILEPKLLLQTWILILFAAVCAVTFFPPLVFFDLILYKYLNTWHLQS